MAQRTLSKSNIPNATRVRGLNIEIVRTKELLSDPNLDGSQRTTLTTKLDTLLIERRNCEQ